MPTLWAHSHYWADKPYGGGGGGGSSDVGQYPAWQATVVCGSLLGAFQVLYEYYMTRKK